MAHATCNRKTPEPRGLLLLRRVKSLTGQAAQSRAEATHPAPGRVEALSPYEFQDQPFRRTTLSYPSTQVTTSRRLCKLFPLLGGASYAVMVQSLGRRMQECTAERITTLHMAKQGASR